MRNYTKLIAGVFCALALTFTACATTNDTDSQWALTLAGNGITTTTSDSQSHFGAELGIGRTGTLWFPLEAGVRQTVALGDYTLFDTRVYSDWTILTHKKFDLSVGANLGVTYGDTVAIWSAAPEVVAKYWVKKDVSIYTRLEYPIDLDRGAQNVLKYTVGFSIRF